MRIEKIRMENLNSLYGVHEIDFTNEQYRDQNLFLIWGDTGSGKSTVLDAITLALFGCTPRLDKITKSSNEIMSKGTDQCSAEVTFCIDGHRYRARWAQTAKVIKRGERKGQRELNDYTVEFCEIQENGESVLFSGGKRTDIQEKIQAVLKLSYENFTKAVLLEQGNFERFLNASKNEKSEILENLTGMVIYSNLSKRAFQVCGEKEKVYQALLKEEEKEGRVLLTPEQMEVGKREEESRQIEIAQLKKNLESVGKALQWLASVEKARETRKKLETEKESFSREREAFAPEQARLEKGMRAAKVANAYDLRQKATDGWNHAVDTLRAQEEALPLAVADEEQARVNAQNAESAWLRAKDEKEQADPIIQKVRELKATLRSQEEQRESFVNQRNKLDGELQKLASDIVAAQREIDNKQARLKKAETGYFVEYAGDAHIREDIGGIREKGRRIASCRETLCKAAKAYEDAEASLQKARKDAEKTDKAVSSAREKCLATQDALKNARDNHARICDGHALEDIEDRLAKTREIHALRLQVASCEEIRKTLCEGKECPVCGATHHPYREGSVPQASETEAEIARFVQWIKQIKKAKSELDAAEKADNEARNELEKQQILLQSTQKTIAEQENAVDEKREVHEQARADADDAMKDFGGSVERYGFASNPTLDVDGVIQSLAERQKRWDKCVAARDQIQAELDEAQKSLNAHLIAQQSKQPLLADARSGVEQQDARIADTRAEIVAIFGDRDVDAEDNRLKKALADSEKQRISTQNILSERNKRVAAMHATIAQRRENADMLEKECAEAEKQFGEAMLAYGFAGESEFVAAHLAPKELDALGIRAEELQKRGIDLDVRLRESVQQCEALEKQAVTERSMEELTGEREEKSRRRDALLSDSGQWTNQLAQNAQRMEQARELREKIVKAESDLKRWKALNDLIGQADGAKYRSFAQGLTFNLLLRNANRYLRDRKLMERYELVRRSSEDQSLEFCLFDYQTGKIRPSDNLSGGEKFCLSLALALSLSEMASQNVSIDSLFVDEGLGTLDDNTLDTALMMLRNLGGTQRDRMVGLVSHVSRARDNIPTQIVVEKIGNGRSRLSGPGCR